MDFRRFRELRRHKTVFLGVLTSLVVATTYCRSIGYDFVSWDDNINVYQDQLLVRVSPASIAQFWLHGWHSLYVPVAYTAFSILSLIGRTPAPSASVTEFDTAISPHVFHAANVVLHVVNSLLVFAIIRKLVKSDFPAVIGTLLFALHPLQVESVAWISELRGLLSAAFGLSSVLVYQSTQPGDLGHKRRQTLAVALYALSLLSKPSAVVIPCVLLVWELLFRNKRLSQSTVQLLPWFGLAVADTLKTQAVQPAMTVGALTTGQRLLVVLDSFGFYLEKVLWPFGLATEYGRTPQRMLQNHWEWQTIPLLIVSIVVLICVCRRFRWALPCVCTFVLLLLPVSGVVRFTYQNYSTVADRYVYLAMLGPAFALAYCLHGLEERPIRSTRLAYLTSSLVLFGLGIQATNQLAYWRNTETLFSHTLAVNPYDWLPRYQLSNDDIRNQRFSAAESQSEQLVARFPSASPFWSNLGLAEQGLGHFSTAISDFDHALALQKKSQVAFCGRAECEATLGQHNQAISDFRDAVDLEPTGPGNKIDYELAMQLGDIGKFGEAVSEFRRTIDGNPSFVPAYCCLAVTYERMGRTADATAVKKQALAIDPKLVLALGPVTDTRSG